MVSLREMRNERHIKKMGGAGQKAQEPRVIADEPMDDEDEESPEKISIQLNDPVLFHHPSIGPSSNKANGETTINNVFARLNQHTKGKSLLGSVVESA